MFSIFARCSLLAISELFFSLDQRLPLPLPRLLVVRIGAQLNALFVFHLFCPLLCCCSSVCTLSFTLLMVPLWRKRTVFHLCFHLVLYLLSSVDAFAFCIFNRCIWVDVRLIETVFCSSWPQFGHDFVSIFLDDRDRDAFVFVVVRFCKCAHTTRSHSLVCVCMQSTLPTIGC